MKILKEVNMYFDSNKVRKLELVAEKGYAINTKCEICGCKGTYQVQISFTKDKYWDDTQTKEICPMCLVQDGWFLSQMDIIDLVNEKNGDSYVNDDPYVEEII